MAKTMFLKIQAAYRVIENELDPELRAKRDSQFREYETQRRDGSGTDFKSRRGAKTKTKDDKDGPGGGAGGGAGQWTSGDAYRARDTGTNYDY